MDGSRRVRATSVLPRYGSPCLLKGHLSTKSNAAVDCSVPLSMSASVKYADQQRREKLKKELARCERELKLNKTAMPANSKSHSKSLFNTLQKPSGEPQEEDVLLGEVNGFPSFTRSPGTSSERLRLHLPRSEKVLPDGPEKSPSSSVLSEDCAPSGPRKARSGASCGRGPRGTVPNTRRFQLVISKAPSGDLLDKHSELFSNRHLPFTPRTLKTEAKSFLSHYRYYTPAKRKKEFTDQWIEAETQTDLSSFKSDSEAVETKNFTESEKNIEQASNCVTYDPKEKITPLPLQGHDLPWEEMKDGTPQCSSPRAECQYSLRCPPERKIHSDEEELLYLSFIEDVTDEILKLGLFSNRFLERLFERHIKQNKHHLEEEKMRHLLRVLKVDLGCASKENLVELDDMDMLNVLDLEQTEDSEKNDYKSKYDVTIRQERQQYQRALDMLLALPKGENQRLSSPNEFFLPIYKPKYSERAIIQQVNDEMNPGPSVSDEKNPTVSDGLTDQETSVNVIEGDSDTEKMETSNELCHLSTELSPSLQLHRVQGDSSHDMEGPTLKIMEMSIEDRPLGV
ncbi:spermatogenesis-associated protein 7 isoform X2 [Suricata suricatta]|uniref:Spermatogenesis associated 7 n=1 Tax=Suricata suricatta TaxID=37032 RepID=A0A673V0V8_SURSU|nr:spermatogenesis-associated protein 7 isoform X2 [Suricata suricatta]